MGAEMNRATISEVDRLSTALRLPAQRTGRWGCAGRSRRCATGRLPVNEHGPILVPDYNGSFYGWPYSYFGQNLDPPVMPRRPDIVEKPIVPDYALSSHVAPLGLALADSLPQKYRGGAFVGHGVWDRYEFNGYKVVFVPFSGRRPNVKAEDVVTLNSYAEARGRPVAVAVDTIGALLIADDVGNTVWRVASAGP
jgi:glucose/arabinose dehydrogenase